MNVIYTLYDINFEWDSRKASTNLRKHGVAFDTACESFFDPFLRVGDAGTFEGESRESITGFAMNWLLLHVVYVIREDDVIRIISARPVTETERRLYEDQ